LAQCFLKKQILPNVPTPPFFRQKSILFLNPKIAMFLHIVQAISQDIKRF
jgi:hypothetical protein